MVIKFKKLIYLLSIWLSLKTSYLLLCLVVSAFKSDLKLTRQVCRIWGKIFISGLSLLRFKITQPASVPKTELELMVS